MEGFAKQKKVVNVEHFTISKQREKVDGGQIILNKTKKKTVIFSSVFSQEHVSMNVPTISLLKIYK